MYSRVRTVSLPKINICLPVIGFGCSALMGGGRKNALRLLETAFEAGVRHFDVARSYGAGEAEGALGLFLASHRSQVTITTKFGIQPAEQSATLRTAIHCARHVARFVPFARRLFNRAAGTLNATGVFGVENIKRGLDTSLRELRTDYVDIFLLHEYTADERNDDLLAFLESAVRVGKIRHFGIGATLERILKTTHVQPELCHIVQFANSVLDRNYRRFLYNPSAIFITHTALGDNYRRVSTYLMKDRSRLKQWSAEIGVNCADSDTLAALMLNYAVQTNPNGLILTSTKKPARIVRNVKAVLEPNVSNVQVSRFADLVASNLCDMSPASPGAYTVLRNSTGIDEKVGG